MATEILMPALSPTMTEGKLASWLKNVGDEVRAGDVIAEIETDKATMEVEAVDEGKLARILVDEGTEGVAGEHRRSRCSAPKARDASAARARAGSQAAPNRRRRNSPLPAAAAEAAPRRAGRGTRRTEWGPTKPITVREALRDAMAAGNAPRQGRVPDRRGSRAVPGRLQDQPGPAGRVRAAPRHRHADHRAWLCRHGRGRGDERAEADRRVHDLQLRHAGDRPDHQFRRQDAVYVRRPDGLPDRVPRPERRGLPRRRRSTASATPAGTRIARA